MKRMAFLCYTFFILQIRLTNSIIFSIYWNDFILPIHVHYIELSTFLPHKKVAKNAITRTLYFIYTY